MINRQFELIRELTVPLNNRSMQDQTRLCPPMFILQSTYLIPQFIFEFITNSCRFDCFMPVLPRFGDCTQYNQHGRCHFYLSGIDSWEYLLAFFSFIRTRLSSCGCCHSLFIELSPDGVLGPVLLTLSLATR